MHIAIDQAVNIDTGAGLALAQLLEEIFMKLQLNKLMAGLVMAGGVVALVGCGGGGTPDLVVTENLSTKISKNDSSAITAAKTILSEASSVSVTVPSTGLEFTQESSPGNTATVAGNAPANSVLTVTPSTTTGLVGTFAISSGTDNEVTGDVEPGSCVFVVRGIRGFLATRFTLGGRYIFPVCTITLPIVNTVLSTPRTVVPTLTLGNINQPSIIVLTAPKTITVTVNPGTTTNTATVTVGSTTLPTNITLPTGTAP